MLKPQLIILGDDSAPYYTVGQMATVTGMDKVVKESGAEFMLALGDNYYHSGVTKETDTRFQTTFESVYTPDSLQFPWYVVAGNHGTRFSVFRCYFWRFSFIFTLLVHHNLDHKGNVSAQIAYSKDSKRWIFPSSYHSHSFTADDGATIDIILIDTG